MVSQHALQVVSQHALQQVSKGVVSQHALQVSRPTPRREVEGDLARGQSQGPHPRGKLRSAEMSCVCVLRPVSVFCILHYVRHKYNVRRHGQHGIY